MRRTALQSKPLRRWAVLTGLALWTAASAAPLALQGHAATGQNSAVPLSRAPIEWARDAAENEIMIVRYNTPYLRYRVHRIDAKGDQTRDVIESRDGTVARLIGRSGKPLTKLQDESERGRLEEMIHSPEAFANHIKSDQSGKKTAVELLQMMPAAMIYSYAPGQPQRPGAPASGGHPDVVLDFKPNPGWKPPSLSGEALTGLEGRLWINPETKVVTRLDGRIVQGVNFGWGIFAHLYPGGTVSLEQVSLPARRFIISHFTDDLSLRAMMVRTVKVHSDITASSFTSIPELNYQQAIQALLATAISTID